MIGMFQKFEKDTGFKIGKIIAEGNGTIYAIKDHPDKVVKISTFDSYNTTKRFFNYLIKVKKLKGFPASRIYKFGKLPGGYYYYVMDKLKPLNVRESNTVNMCDDIYDLDLSNKMVKFLRAAQYYSKKHKLTYGDWHSYNIMKDNKGNYKFVDLESFLHSRMF